MVEEFNPTEDELKFQEHPDLEAEVKEKIFNVMQGRVSTPLINLRDALKFLSGRLGVKLAAILCSIDDKDYVAFSRLKRPKVPTQLQQRNIGAAYLIVDILISHLPEPAVQDWLVAYSPYLHGVPAVEMSRRPEDVRIAALNLVTNGESESVI